MSYFGIIFHLVIQGLKKSLLPNEQVPDIFNDELFNVSATWTL